MPFKSKKQKKTIDAAAHNPAFAKKVGIKTSDAKKMSAHGKGQTKFEEARTEVKDKDGKVTSWKDEGEWKKAAPKNGRGKVTNLSDKARRETEKLSKPEKEMAEQFEKAMEGSIRGGVWTSQPPDKGQKDVPPPQEVDGGILNKKQPKPVNAPRPVKKAEVTPTVSTDDKPSTEVAEGKKKPSKIKDAMKKNKIKALKENIQLVYQLLSEAKKAGKCSCATNEDTCKVHGKMKEGLKGGQKKLDVAPPKGKLTGADFKALKGKKKTEEAIDQNKDGKNDFEDVKIARMKAAMKGKSKKVKEGSHYGNEKLANAKASRSGTSTVRDQDGKGGVKTTTTKKPAKTVKEGKDAYLDMLYQKLQEQK